MVIQLPFQQALNKTNEHYQEIKNRFETDSPVTIQHI